MISQSNAKVVITRTERGLTISGTRITLYDVMDYVKAQYPSKFIQGLFELTDEQINAALSYIEVNYDAVEAEYAQVIQETKELQVYYANQNRDRPQLNLNNPRSPLTQSQQPVIAIYSNEIGIV